MLSRQELDISDDLSIEVIEFSQPPWAQPFRPTTRNPYMVEGNVICQIETSISFGDGRWQLGEPPERLMAALGSMKGGREKPTLS
ncbi:hypothetical protein VPNG_09257 [Cytospora leucostoma]|uniref:Uncharacterized protein n=1 Tax=Cytospora leucostoma TaxID=1230097 RepID=A0A423W0K0_9PEZI|nr:hypothetical protein VPNG_09257 [Cytospora leucostoma]